MRSRAGEDRHFKAAIIGSPLHVPVAGGLAILEHVCWLSTGFVHLIELTPPMLLPLGMACAGGRAATEELIGNDHRSQNGGGERGLSWFVEFERGE